MSEPTHRFEAHCTSCKAAFVAEVVATQRKRIKAASGNRDVWMQTHHDTTEHARFSVDDSIHSHRIVGGGQQMQMMLSDEEGYSTFTV